MRLPVTRGDTQIKLVGMCGVGCQTLGFGTDFWFKEGLGELIFFKK